MFCIFATSEKMDSKLPMLKITSADAKLDANADNAKGVLMLIVLLKFLKGTNKSPRIVYSSLIIFNKIKQKPVCRAKIPTYTKKTIKNASSVPIPGNDATKRIKKLMDIAPK